MKQIFNDNQGKISSYRVIMLIIVLWFVFMSVYHAINDSLTDNWVTLLLGALGVIFTGKVGQKYLEDKNNVIK